MEGKVSQLAEKLLQEGVQKGEAEKEKILEAARSEAQVIKETAEQEATKVLAQAEKSAAELKANAEKEIKLAGDQAVSALQQKIANMVTLTAVDDSIKATLADPKVMAAYIKTVLSNWKGELGSDASIELLLPEDQKDSLEKDLTAALGKTLSKGVTVTFSKAVKGGFQIAPANESYKVTLSNDDFAEFFKEYLRPRVRSILFGV